MTHLIGALSLAFVSWSSYKIIRPLTTRSGKLPGQRAEDPLRPAQLTLWLSDMESRGVVLSWEDGCFTLAWPSLESYGYRDVERVRVNWSALLTHFKLRTVPGSALPILSLVCRS